MSDLLDRVSTALTNASILWPHSGGAEHIRKLRQEFDAWRAGQEPPALPDAVCLNCGERIHWPDQPAQPTREVTE